MVGFNPYLLGNFLKSRQSALSMNFHDDALHHWEPAGWLIILPVGVIMGVLLGMFIQFFGIALNA
ncbi:MAG: hypothetical protein ABFD58_05670 [Anaerolineaceae bacterium]